MSTNADKVSAAPLGKTRFDYLIFVVAVCFLLIILLAGFIDSTIQTNILYLVVVSLSSSMVFAFLPFDATFHYRELFKAGGTAAVFGFCLYIVTSFTANDYMSKKNNADIQINNLQQSLKDRDKEIELLRSATSKMNTSTNSTSQSMETLSRLLGDLTASIKALRGDINEAIQFSSAARDNSSDARTCSLRGSQSLAALSRSIPRLELFGIDRIFGAQLAQIRNWHNCLLLRRYAPGSFIPVPRSDRAYRLDHRSSAPKAATARSSRPPRQRTRRRSRAVIRDSF